MPPAAAGCCRSGPPPAAAAWASAGCRRWWPRRAGAARRWSPGSASPQDQGPKDRRQGPHDPELAEGPAGDVVLQDQDDAAEQDDRGGRGDDRAAVQVALARRWRLRGPVVAVPIRACWTLTRGCSRARWRR